MIVFSIQLRRIFNNEKNWSQNSKFQVSGRVQTGVGSSFNDIVRRNKIHGVQG